MKKGIYYIGDPCYIFNESWIKVLNEVEYFIGEEQILFGEVVIGGNTAHGDGTYIDNSGREYAVDAGIIAILPVNLINIDKHISLSEINGSDCMHIVKFDKDFECEIDNGYFTFGDITIDTDDQMDEDEF